MQTSRIQRVTSYGPPIAYVERGAMGGYRAFDKMTDCKTKPYVQDGKVFVPSFKRACAMAWYDVNDPNKEIDGTFGDIALYVRNTLGTDQGAAVTTLSKVMKQRYGTFGNIPEHDPSIDLENYDKVNPDVIKNKGPEIDLLASIGKAIEFITNPQYWLAMLSILVGFGVIGIAIWKGLQ